MDFYRDFSKKRHVFRELYESDSSDSDSLSEDLPSPSSPFRRKNRYQKSPGSDYGDMYEKMRDLQRQIYTLELKNKKEKNKKR